MSNKVDKAIELLQSIGNIGDAVPLTAAMRTKCIQAAITIQREIARLREYEWMYKELSR